MALEIVICFDPVTKEVVKCKEGKGNKAFESDNSHLKSTEIITSGTPYIVRSDYSGPLPPPSGQQQAIFRELSMLPAQSRRNIAAMLRDYNSDLLTALSDFQSEILVPYMKQNSHGILGSGATSVEARSSNFVKLANKYSESLKEIRRAHKSGVPKYHVVALEQKAFSIYKELQTTFRAELQRFMNINKASKRGTIWSNPNRGINIAKSTRHSANLNIKTTKEFQKIKRLEQSAKWLGNTMILLDGGLRANKVYEDYENGKDWHRTLATEMTAFGVSTAFGIGIATVVTNTLSATLMLTPYGWVIALGIGLYLGFQASVLGNKYGKKLSEHVYDRKMPSGVNF
ncbi:hypothetical protein [Pseudoalteromonas ruthenica]|uniref:hypothetical protein n=1 Tax=Pseudoalteromonas ruthenica TaxID=151081 RepID=UPI001247E673|nr:hypothetical protein [Pseudoalteromonas ruthenica]